jgi:hypothetical protein
MASPTFQIFYPFQKCRAQNDLHAMLLTWRLEKVMVSSDKAVALERAPQWWVEEFDKGRHSISALVGSLIRETALCYREIILVSQLLEMLVSNRGRRARESGSKVERAHHLHRCPPRNSHHINTARQPIHQSKKCFERGFAKIGKLFLGPGRAKCDVH